MSFQRAAADFIRAEMTKNGSCVWDGGAPRALTDEDRIEVVLFEFDWDDGYSYSSYTYEDPSFTVSVRYRLNGEQETRTMSLYKEESRTMGDFLTGLLKHEEAAR